jgi:hypothetical protein
MRKNTFRTVDFWKSAVMTMPDNSFYELMRSVFGKIKTPFTKQQLLNDMEQFLLREDIQKAIAAYIDENDAKIIAAVALFTEPVPGELESFFTGEFSYAQLQDMIVNLEERFILYRFTEGKTSYLALNPVLEQILLPIASDVRALFPAVSEADASGAARSQSSSACLNDRVLAGLLSFVCQWELFYRSEGVIRKRVIEAGRNCFPGIDLEKIICALQILGLFYVDGEKLLPDKKRFDDFGSLSARERSEYCASALLICGGIKSPAELLPPLYRSRIRETVNFIHSFLDYLDPELYYGEKTLNRLAEVLRAASGTDLVFDEMIEALEKTGLITAPSRELKQCADFKNKTKKNTGPFIAVDSNFSILVYPEISYADVISLAGFLDIKEAGAVVRFELNKDSAIRSFDRKTGAQEIIELLNRLSGGRVDDSLVWNLKDWEKRHEEVSLKKGVILCLCEERRFLTQTMPLAGLIVETIAPGIYLLAENAMDAAADALRGAGIDIIARSRVRSKTAAASGYFLSPSPYSADEKITVMDSKTPRKTGGGAAVLSTGFRAILEKMPLGETERAELSARIDRRLVLCEAQLKDANVRYEKLEARHMDYAGKQNIAKQAIAQQSPVEIIWPAGRSESIFGVPRALEKDEGELILTVVTADSDDVMRIPLAKISLLRRIKKSIFEK